MSSGNAQANHSDGDDLHAQNLQTSLDRAATSRNADLITKWYEFQLTLCRKNMINDLNALNRFYVADGKPDVALIIKNQEKIIR